MPWVYPLGSHSHGETTTLGIINPLLYQCSCGEESMAVKIEYSLRVRSHFKMLFSWSWWHTGELHLWGPNDEVPLPLEQPVTLPWQATLPSPLNRYQIVPIKKNVKINEMVSNRRNVQGTRKLIIPLHWVEFSKCIIQTNKDSQIEFYTMNWPIGHNTSNSACLYASHSLDIPRIWQESSCRPWH